LAYHIDNFASIFFLLYAQIIFWYDAAVTEATVSIKTQKLPLIVNEAHGWNMSFTPSNSRTFGANTGLGLKLTPANSPYARTPRSPHRARNQYELSLKRIVGTTVCSPLGFDSLNSPPSLRIFAYVAGASAVVVHLDENLESSQRFFRARPTAVPAVITSDPSAAPSTPKNTANDSRNRTVASLREIVGGYSPSTPYTTQIDWSDSPTSKTWTSRERIKAATCLSISKDARFLAVGEVSDQTVRESLSTTKNA